MGQEPNGVRVPCQGKMLEATGGHALGEYMNDCLNLTVTQNMLPLKVVMPLSLEMLYPRKCKFSGTRGKGIPISAGILYYRTS